MTAADPVLGMRILIVDDEPLNVELLAAIRGRDDDQPGTGSEELCPVDAGPSAA
jgi:hypothetical protein